jgi:DNA-binding response OmpR family regulator
MTKHFPTVPVDGALRAAQYATSNAVRPLALVVDDDPMITATLSAILSGSGLAAMTASDGLVALDTALLIPPEILISDLAIPGINGFDLALEVTRAARDCDVILFAPHASAANLHANMRAAQRSFTVLIKPVHPADLLEAVFVLLSGRGLCITQPRPWHAQHAYDFLSSTRVITDTYPAPSNVTLRHRPRAGTPVA